MTLRALESGWYLTNVSRVAHYFEPWEANDFFSRADQRQIDINELKHNPADPLPAGGSGNG